jgi:hypothetical protein
MTVKCPDTAAEAKALGYCITSRRHLLASRIDCADWREVMGSKYPGAQWVKKGCNDRAAADQYRRCHSKDSVSVPSGWLKQLPNSGEGPTEFLNPTQEPAK